MRIEGKKSKSVWWNEEVKAVVRRKESAWKQALAVSDEEKKRCLEAYSKERRKVKRCIYQRKKKVNEQFGKKMDEDVNGNRKLLWNKMRYVKSCSRIKDGNERLEQKEDEVGRIWKEYVEDLYNIDTQKQVALMEFREVTILGDSQLEELRLR